MRCVKIRLQSDSAPFSFSLSSMHLPDDIWEVILAHHGPLHLLRDVMRKLRVAALRVQRRWRATYTSSLCSGDHVALLCRQTSTMRFGIVQRKDGGEFEIHLRGNKHIFFVHVRDHRFQIIRRGHLP